MYVSRSISSSRRRLSLALRVSALLVLAVVLPLLITVVVSELILRPTLLAQAEKEMGNDAQSHAQTIDALLIARMQDVSFLGQYFAVQHYLAGDTTYKQQALSELALGYRLDPNYSTWTLFDAHGNIRLSYPALPGLRGKYLVAPEIMQQLHGINKTRVSDVYFDDTTHMAFVDIYTSVTAPDGTLLGFGRSTLKLNEIWTLVDNETNAAPGSYAMIFDNHGVRVAYTNNDTTHATLPEAIFKAIAPLTTQMQQRIKDENLYGNSGAAVKVLPDPTLASMQQDAQAPPTFQLTPALQSEPFQAYRVSCKVVPWTYLVLRPVNTIIGAANQQDIYLVLIAAIITLLAALVGLFIGRGITYPILKSVSSLLKSSHSLNELASSEQVIATEQRWIVDASQAGLKSVEYYIEATSVAARKLDAIGRELIQNWQRLEPWQIQLHLGQIMAIADYISNAAAHQGRSNKGLAATIRVTKQVTDQLVSGATSAAEASAQLEDVIKQLRQVIGE